MLAEIGEALPSHRVPRPPPLDDAVPGFVVVAPNAHALGCPLTKPVGAIVFVTIRSHGNDGASTAQVISVVDGDDASFLLFSRYRHRRPGSRFRPRPKPGPGMDTNTTSTWKPRSGLKDSLVLNLPANVANISYNRAVRCKTSPTVKFAV